VCVLGPDGERVIPIVDFHPPPGDEPQRDTVLAHGELITAAREIWARRFFRNRLMGRRDRCRRAGLPYATARRIRRQDSS